MERDLLTNKQLKIHRALGVVYITRAQMVLFIQGMQNVLTVPFPQEIIRDLDIINQAKFASFLAELITTQKLQPASLTILLANDLLFAKQMLSNDPNAQNLEEQTFVDMVPFEEFGVQKIPFNNAVYITVANKDLYEGMIKAFELNNFIVSMVLAAYMFSKEVNFAVALTPQALAVIIPKFNNLKQFNFLKLKAVVAISDVEEKSPIEKTTTITPSDTSKEPPKKNNKTLIIVGLFIMFIGILISVYLWSSQQQQLPKKNTVATPITVKEVSKESLPTSTPKSTDIQGVSDMEISLQYPINDTQNALLIADSLNQLGFEQIQKEEINSSDGTIISFNNSISQETKNKIITSVSRVYEKIIIQNSNTFKNPVTIQLGTD